jgi:adenylylsulfate reductase subunit B
MSIRINQHDCVGCGRCTTVCPGNLIRMDRGKAVLREEKDCWGCASCIKECHARAIEFFLAEDLGGGDVTMKVKKAGPVLYWDFYRADRLLRTIPVNTKDANRY